MSCRRFWISGRVQGVFFRETTRREAEALGLSGYAHNLSDGRVEVLACGAPEALEALQRWLAKGPPWARVERVRAEDAADAPPPGFSTG